MKSNLFFTIIAAAAAISATPATECRAQSKTTFQSSCGWKPSIDNRADAVMVYGTGDLPTDPAHDEFRKRLQSWREKGYNVHFMTGIAWGNYEEYFEGRWDGRTHFDEGQVNMAGDTIRHNPTVPYIVPTRNYLEYFKETQIKRTIDAGVDTIFLEEPEFWAYSGYSESFKREWQEYYGSEWRPQDESPASTYLSNKLKYHLYLKALNEVFTYAKKYGRSLGRDIKCYVPTHSLINYSQWQIVSPEASLSLLPCVDGYIGQVWTGTSRTKNIYDGTTRERVFETAYLEYECLKAMALPAGRRVIFLTDPIEDQPQDWEDYKRNYEATFTAKILHPEVAEYEVMPWPDRIYNGLYRRSATDTTKEGIPATYAAQMQVMVNALNHIPVSEEKVSGAHGISVLMANSLMFQQFPIHAGYDDPNFSNFFGLAMPPFKKGIPVEITHIENVGQKDALKDVKVLLMTYSNMKPLDPAAHDAIACWVKEGGSLIYCGRDDDPFISVPEWWNTGENHYASPSGHLFEKLGIHNEAAAVKMGDNRTFACGNGSVSVIRRDPKEFVVSEGGDAVLMEILRQQYKKTTGQKIPLKNSFDLRRGCYRIVSVIDEGVSGDSYTLTGRFIDLYDPELPAVTKKSVAPGSQCLLVDIDAVKDRERPQVVASGCRVYDENTGNHSYSFVGKGPEKTNSPLRILLPAIPISVKLNGTAINDRAVQWDETTHTCKLCIPNSPDGFAVTVIW